MARDRHRNRKVFTRIGETAAALDIAEGTVKSRLSRALTLLEQELVQASANEATPQGMT